MFPTEFEDKTEKGDKIWDEMMPRELSNSDFRE